MYFITDLAHIYNMIDSCRYNRFTQYPKLLHYQKLKPESWKVEGRGVGVWGVGCGVWGGGGVALKKGTSNIPAKNQRMYIYQQ